MSYGPVPCDDKPNYMEAAPTQRDVEHDGQLMAAVSIDPLIEAIDDVHAKNCAQGVRRRDASDGSLSTATVDFPADAEEESCDALLAIMEKTRRTACAARLWTRAAAL